MSSLLDIPIALLSELIACVHEQISKHSLFSACKVLRDIILARADGVQCLLDTRHLNPTQAARSLQLLKQCKTGAQVKLVLQGAGGSFAYDAGWDLREAAVFSSWLSTLCTQHGAVLKPVTHVVFKASVLGGMVPDELIACCPRLTHVTRYGRLHLSNIRGVDMGPCQQLQHLTIFDSTEDEPVVHLLQQQLDRLPNLQSLHYELQSDEDELVSDHLMLSVQPLSTRLQSLTIPCGQVMVAALCVSVWPQLQRLHLNRSWLYDRDLDVLLQHAPQVTDVLVERYNLKHSFADRECNWQDLRLRSGLQLVLQSGACP